MTSFTVTVTAHNALAVADAINVAHSQGPVTVNGVVPASPWGAPAARAWGNGTVSVRTAAKAKGKFRDVFVKVGSVLTLTDDSCDCSTTSPEGTCHSCGVNVRRSWINGGSVFTGIAQ